MNKYKEHKHLPTKRLFATISISIALLFWFFDSIVHYFVFSETAFEVLPSDLNELWMRCVIVVLIVAFGVFADRRIGFEKVDVYRAMLGATNHILRNHLQSMLLFRDEAENCKDYDKYVLGVCRTWHRNSSRQGHPVKNHALFLGYEDNLRSFSAGTTFPLNFSSRQGMHSFQIPTNADQTPFTLNGV